MRIDGIEAWVDEIEGQVVADRRDFHRYAESGWTEFRTASLIARRLTELGYKVEVGHQVVVAEARMGVPPAETLDRCWRRATEEGGDATFMERMRGGFTGVVGVLQGGPGPCVGLRFDIDAVGVTESASTAHRPTVEGFASVHPGVAHACGHDGHAAVGLGVAAVLARFCHLLEGQVKLIFQPAEEGVRGAKSMVRAGVVDDVDYIVGHHLYSHWPLGEICGGVGGYLATTKFDARLAGYAAHAAGEPQKGRNALLAAATAALNLYAISRHRGGSTRINVGRLSAGTGRNVIPAEAWMTIETRGDTSALNDYMYERALQVLQGAADMYQCSLEIEAMGGAESAKSDPDLARRVEETALRLGGVTIRQSEQSGGSEDFTYMMKRVQERGGLATNIGIGADLGKWGHHTPEFDFDERALGRAVRLLSVLALDLAQG
jgi:aminobenzoyl-glutamate utilization protein A